MTVATRTRRNPTILALTAWIAVTDRARKLAQPRHTDESGNVITDNLAMIAVGGILVVAVIYVALKVFANDVLTKIQNDITSL